MQSRFRPHIYTRKSKKTFETKENFYFEKYILRIISSCSKWKKNCGRMLLLQANVAILSASLRTGNPLSYLFFFFLWGKRVCEGCQIPPIIISQSLSPFSLHQLLSRLFPSFFPFLSPSQNTFFLSLGDTGKALREKRKWKKSLLQVNISAF